jgi:hypothetical protein
MRSGIHALIQVFPSGSFVVQITVFSILDVSFHLFGDFRFSILFGVHGYLHKLESSFESIPSLTLEGLTRATCSIRALRLQSAGHDDGSAKEP